MSEATTTARRRDLALLLAVAAVPFLAALLRLPAALHRPLWLDETSTAIITSQPTLSAFYTQWYLDASAPLYFVVERLWISLAGQSDIALRLPSLIFSVLAPLVALSPASGASRSVRMLWCVLLACWVPGNYFAPEARCYALLLFLATLNAIAFARVMRAPGLSTAFAWAGLSSLIILTHYFGLVLAAVQGVVYLSYHRWRAVRTWPAAILYLPAFAVLGIHTQRIVGFSTPGQTWLGVTGADDLAPQLSFLLGGDLVLVLALWAGVSLLAERLGRRASERSAAPTDHVLWITVASSIGAAIVCVIAGAMRPILIVRYLTPMEPGVLLGLALYAERLARGWRWSPPILGVIYIALLIGVSLIPDDDSRWFNFEIASRALMPARPTRLVYAWDGPMRPDPRVLEQLGGYFFRREGHPIIVDPIAFKTGEDPNAVILAHADVPGGAIIWMYDKSIPGTAAIAHPPAMSLLSNRGWRCRVFGDGTRNVIACQKTPWKRS